MDEGILKVEYHLENDNMTDKEYEDQDEKEFVITKEMLIELVYQRVELKDGNSICSENFYVNKI